MLEFGLLSGLLAFAVLINRWLKTSTDEHEKMRERHNKRKILHLLPVILVIMAGCDAAVTDGRNDRDGDSLVIERNVSDKDYEVYFTREDLDHLKDELPDSVGIVFSRAEYEGMRLFMTNCNRCHPGGEQGTGPSLIDKPVPDFLIHFQVRSGKGDMPAFTKEELPKEDVKKIVLFIDALREDYKAKNNTPN